jgi:hypothetical protein
MLNANTGSHNNIDGNGTTETKHAKQLPGNKSQQSHTTTTLSNTALTQSPTVKTQPTQTLLTSQIIPHIENME